MSREGGLAAGPSPGKGEGQARGHCPASSFIHCLMSLRPVARARQASTAVLCLQASDPRTAAGPAALLQGPWASYTAPWMWRGAQAAVTLRGNPHPTHQLGFSAAAAALGLNLMSLFTLKRTSSSVSGGTATWYSGCSNNMVVYS